MLCVNEEKSYSSEKGAHFTCFMKLFIKTENIDQDFQVFKLNPQSILRGSCDGIAIRTPMVPGCHIGVTEPKCYILGF